MPITTDICKAISEYVASGLDPIALLGEVFAKAADTSADTIPAAKLGSLPSTSSPSQTPNVQTPEHQMAAHRALAAHHLHNYHYAMSQKGPEAAAPFAAKHLAHQAAVNQFEENGVQDTPQHHLDLYNHYAGKLRGKSTTQDPVKTDAPTYSLASAHADHLTRMGHGMKVGEPEQQEKPPGTGSRLFAGTTFTGDPKVEARRQQMVQARPFASMLHEAGLRQPPAKDVPPPASQSRQFAQRVPNVQDVASKPSGARPAGSVATASAIRPSAFEPTAVDRPVTQTTKSFVLITSLLKSAEEFQKDYGYGGQAEAEELQRPQKPTLPSLFPKHKQEQRVSHQQSEKRKRQTEESFGIGKSLQILNQMLCQSS
jgi:hypothetical protein